MHHYSRFITETSVEPIPTPEWIAVQPHYEAHWTVNELGISWPKKFTLCHEYGLICSETRSTIWSMNSHCCDATIYLTTINIATIQNTSSLQFQAFVKNIGDWQVTSDPVIDKAVYFCIVSEITGVVMFTGVSLQRVMTLSIGNDLTQQCLAPRRKKIHKIFSRGKQFLSPFRLLSDEKADNGEELL